MKAALLSMVLVLAGCAASSPPLATTPSPGCDFRVRDLNRRLCEEQGGTFRIIPGFTHPCGACELP